MINNTSIGKQMHIAKEDKHRKGVVGVAFSSRKKKQKKEKQMMAYFGFLTVKDGGYQKLTVR